MTIKITPIVFTIRGYKNNVDTSQSLFDLRDIPHTFVCTVQIIETTAYISGFMGKMTLADRKSISDVLRNDYGVTKAEWRRKDIVVTKIK